MKKLSLFLLASTLMAASSSQAIGISFGGWGHTYWSEPLMHVSCWNAGQCPYDPYHSLPACAPFCDTPDLPYAISIWVDFATAAATALDAAVTWMQNDKTVDAKNAVDELEQSLKGSCSGAEDDETSLEPEAMDVLAPQIVVDALNASEEKLDLVREKVEDYVFETDKSEINGDCKDSHNKCAENRQNTWALLSVSFAQAMGHKVIWNTTDGDDKKFSNNFDKLKNDFNAQTSPIGMWGAMSNMTLDTHIQMNDINALFARDLEMSALGGLNNSGTRKFQRLGI